MSATHFKVDLEDIRFVLFDQLKVQDVLKDVPEYSAFDKDLYDATLDECRRISEEVLFPINRSGDRSGGVKYDASNNTVKTPEGYKAAWEQYSSGGWIGAAANPEHGGMGLPMAVGVAVVEMFTGGSMAFTMYGGLTAGVARVIGTFAGPDHKPWAQKLFSGEWGGTMCLTEAGAGTAVGDNRTKATRTETPGTYLLEGEKIFITGAEQDLTEQIVHLVLARTPDAPAGSKGLSIFLVPKFILNADGSLGERNDAFVVGVEHKMGILGSATCTLALGQRTNKCVAYRVGDEGQGMEIMFTLMNEARIGVGIQGVATAAAAHSCALSYAKERVQGTSVANMRDANAARVTIVNHPDVRRNLLNQKAIVETMRSLVYRIAVKNDIAEHTTDKELKAKLHGTVELLVPILKSYCSDQGYQVCVDALQVYGGYGYTAEYPAEQYVRDAKITSIYEGTNGVQAMDLLGRKLRMKGGALFMAWMQEIQQDLAMASFEGFGEQSEMINKALNQVGSAAMHLGGLGMQGKVDGAMLMSMPFLNAMGNVALAVEAMEQARVAKRLIAERGETPHLVGKLVILDYYVKNILPAATGLCKQVQSGDESALDARLFA